MAALPLQAPRPEVSITVRIKVKVGLRLWDALKLRLAGPEVRKAVIEKAQVFIDKAVAQ